MEFTQKYKIVYKDLDYPHKLAYNSAVCMLGFLFKPGSGFKEKFENEDFQKALYAFVVANVKVKDAEKAFDTCKKVDSKNRYKPDYWTTFCGLKKDFENAQDNQNEFYDALFQLAKELNFEKEQENQNEFYAILEEPVLGTSF